MSCCKVRSALWFISSVHAAREKGLQAGAALRLSVDQTHACCAGMECGYACDSLYVRNVHVNELSSECFKSRLGVLYISIVGPSYRVHACKAQVCSAVQLHTSLHYHVHPIQHPRTNQQRVHEWWSPALSCSSHAGYVKFHLLMYPLTNLSQQPPHAYSQCERSQTHKLSLCNTPHPPTMGLAHALAGAAPPPPPPPPGGLRTAACSGGPAGTPPDGRPAPARISRARTPPQTPPAARCATRLAPPRGCASRRLPA